MTMQEQGPRVRRVLWMSAAACAVAAGVGEAGVPIVTPSTEEAVPRGVVYVMMPYPQTQGLFGFGCGFSDLDADGDPDIVLLGAADGHVGIFDNNGAGFFTDRSGTSGIPTLTEASGFAAGDYDGDGLPDLYITQSGEANLLLHNAGDFTFTDVTAQALVGDVGAGTAASWGDLSGDTLLDLYVCNYNGAVPGSDDIDNKLYLNLGTGAFLEIGALQTVDDHGYGFQSVMYDFDKDGDLDLYLSNDRGHLKPLFRTNQLWRNDGGQMVNISVGSGADVGLFSMGVACGDFDGNRWPDLYCTNLAGYDDGYNPLLLNLGSATPPHYFEASAIAGVDHWISSWGSIFYDFNNDAIQDLYVNNMFLPNSLYLGDTTFPCIEMGVEANVTGNAGVSFGSAVADVDGDGDLDLLVNNLSNNVELFINHEGQARHWVKYRMVGQGSNPHAVGGFVDTRTGAKWQMREILAGGNGYLGQNELTIHVGLNEATVIDEVTARWPGGATTRTLTGLPADETWTLYPPERLGDADGGGVVDLDDYVVLQACWDATISPGCEVMDFDGDSVIGIPDYDAFIALYAGPVHDCDGNGEDDLLDILLDPLADEDGTLIPDVCEAAGDLDGDGTVGILDFLILLANWGPCPDPPASCPGDLDGDGTVGILDFLTLLANWG